MIAYFERFELNMTMKQALAVSERGDCTLEVEKLERDPKIARQLNAIDPQKIREELAEYGAWDDDDLTNDHENRLRILWIAGGNIREEQAEKQRAK